MKSWLTGTYGTLLGLNVGADPSRVYEMDWYESKQINDDFLKEILTFDFVPSQHWGMRSPLDENTHLWGGWVVTFNKSKAMATKDDNVILSSSSSSLSSSVDKVLKIYYSGDTGMCANCPLFQDIGLKLGPIDVSFLPIGAYGTDKSRYFLKTQHIDVTEAIQIALDTRSKKAIGCHWGTFCLTDEPLLEPRQKITEILKANQISDDFFQTMHHGETRILE